MFRIEKLYCIHNNCNSFGRRCLSSSSQKTVNETFLNCKKCIIILNVKLKSIYLPLCANYSISHWHLHAHAHARTMTFSCIVISTQGWWCLVQKTQALEKERKKEKETDELKRKKEQGKKVRDEEEETDWGSVSERKIDNTINIASVFVREKKWRKRNNERVCVCEREREREKQL